MVDPILPPFLPSSFQGAYGAVVSATGARPGVAVAVKRIVCVSVERGESTRSRCEHTFLRLPAAHATVTTPAGRAVARRPAHLE